MAKQSLVITVIAHHPYIRHENDPATLAEQELLFSALSETYLPLLAMFSRLERDGVPFRITMVFSPTLCALLTDPAIQTQYIDRLDRIISFGERELERYAPGSEKHELAALYVHTAKENRDLFTQYNCNILKGFDRYVASGHIELMATCATFAFLPHYADMPEIINAQVEVGLISHKMHFSSAPDGFWLPLMGYTPGLEKTLRSYGINYTMIETHSLLFASPPPDDGIFSPARCANSLVVFARDWFSHEQTSGQNGFLRNPVYRNQNRDIAFEESPEYLAGLFPAGEARLPSGYRYWAKGESAVCYDPHAAAEQVKQDAAAFLADKQSRLSQAAQISGESDVSLVCTFSAGVLGGKWHEGVSWLEEIYRQSGGIDTVTPAVCSQLLEHRFSLQKLAPYPAASTGAGYGEDLLDNSNAYLMRYVRKAAERMVDLADRFSNDRGLKARTLNLAAKEMLLAQSSDWPRMLNRRVFADARFREYIMAFSTVFDSLGSNSISTEWLTTYEKKHPIFPWINYRVFSKKKI